LYKKFLNLRTDQNEKAYKSFNKIHTKTIKLAKKQYIENKLTDASKDMKKTWNILNSLLGKTKNGQQIQSLRSNNSVITDPVSLATAFNNYFGNVSAELDDAIPNAKPDVSDIHSQPTEKSIFLSPASYSEVTSVINKLSTSNAVGQDGLSSKIIKLVANEISPSLTNIINKSLSQGQVPDGMKIAKVVPVYKSGDNQNVSNYRPISVLPCFSKILEKIVYTRFHNFLEKNGVLTEHQYGFRSGRSTEDATLKFSQDVIQAFEQNLYTVAVFIDLKKAFDTVNHGRLLNKLAHYGIRGIANQWVESYLQNRKQYVQCSSFSSFQSPVKYGVPQGSILGPLLFLLYINELPKVSNILQSILFADDTTFYLSGSSLAEIEVTINTELEKISDWLCLNRLSLNTEKTSFMIFRARQKPLDSIPEIYINGNKIAEVHTTKFLGLKIDSHLSWNDHIQFIATKISKGAGILHKLKNDLPPICLRLLYYTLVHPHLNYCALTWMNTSKTNKVRLLKLQKKAVRSILHKPSKEPSLPLFKSMKILPVHEFIRYRGGVYIFKNRTINKFFMYSFTIHGHGTRNASDCYTSFNRTEISKLSLLGQTAKIWNSIPVEIRTVASVSLFCKRFFAYVLNGASLLY
jgi:hypothetical protein